MNDQHSVLKHFVLRGFLLKDFVIGACRLLRAGAGGDMNKAALTRSGSAAQGCVASGD